jgi:pimeloyl-ACP methyl ester carboxylesterase
VLDGVGHFPQREAPQAVAGAVLGFLRDPTAASPSPSAHHV